MPSERDGDVMFKATKILTITAGLAMGVAVATPALALDQIRPIRPSLDQIRPISPSLDQIRPIGPSLDQIRPIRPSLDQIRPIKPA